MSDVTDNDKAGWLLGRISFLARRRPEQKAQEALKKGVTLYKDKLTDHQFLRVVRTQELQAAYGASAFAERLNRIGLDSGVDTISLAQFDHSSLLEQNLQLRGLLPFLVPLQRSLTKHNTGQLERIPAEVLVCHPSDTPAVGIAIKIIRLIRGLDPLDEAFAALATISNQLPPYRMLQLARSVGTSPWLTREHSIALLTALSESFSNSDDFRLGQSTSILKSKLDSRPSRFHDPAVCDALSLPVLKGH
jgi:hypothetical protein